VEPCIFQKIDGDHVHFLVVYVDDILMIVSEGEMERLHWLFIEEFRLITMDVGKEQSYLGMQISFLVKITKRIMNQYQNPGRKDLFMVEEENELKGDRARVFHKVVAKLLYLAKRARPDIMTVVIFLCTRMKGPTIGDQRKLAHLLGDLERTRDWPLV